MCEGGGDPVSFFKVLEVLKDANDAGPPFHSHPKLLPHLQEWISAAKSRENRYMNTGSGGSKGGLRKEREVISKGQRKGICGEATTRGWQAVPTDQ